MEIARGAKLLVSSFKLAEILRGESKPFYTLDNNIIKIIIKEII